MCRHEKMSRQHRVEEEVEEFYGRVLEVVGEINWWGEVWKQRSLQRQHCRHRLTQS